MRLPKFRCKNKIGNWCFFTVLHNGNVNEENFDLETLSQFTGLFDKQCVEIYEGDVVYYLFGGNSYVGFIEYAEARFQVRDKAFRNDLDYALTIEVLGNIYENSELLKQ